MIAPFSTRPARDILAGLVEAWDHADELARGTLAARFDEAREAVRVAAGMTSPPPEGAEHTMGVLHHAGGVRLQIHGHTFYLQPVEAEFRARVAASNPGRALPVRLRADGGPLNDGVHPDANGAAERNGWLFIIVLAIAALIGVALAIKGGG